MGIQSKGKYSTDETLHTLNEQLQAPCVNYRCYYCCLWQCCARLRHFESKGMLALQGSTVPKSEIELNAFQQLTAVGQKLGWGKTRNVFGALEIALMAMFVNQEDFWKAKEREQEMTSKHVMSLLKMSLFFVLTMIFFSW